MPLYEDTRINYMRGAFKRRNHKSAKLHEAYLAWVTSKETIKLWDLILLEENAKYIPIMYVETIGISEYKDTNTLGGFLDKLRVTSDLPFPMKNPKESINWVVYKE